MIGHSYSLEDDRVVPVVSTEFWFVTKGVSSLVKIGVSSLITKGVPYLVTKCVSLLVTKGVPCLVKFPLL